MTKQYFKRGPNQYWCKKDNGDLLLINLPQANYHYDGDSHIFFTANKPGFNTDHATKITKAEWESVRDQHLERLKTF